MSTASMRWSPGRKQSWRRVSDGGFDARRYAVAAIAEAEAREYVLARQYSGTWPAVVHRYGLFDMSGTQPRLTGVTALSVPAARAVLTNVFPGVEPYSQSLELGRLVLDDDVAANGETWFLGQVFRLAALKGLRGVVSFSDPVPRKMPDGTIIMPGHVGGVYQAKGAIYTGRGTPRTLVILRDGTVVSARAMQKVRSKDQGHEYLERLLVTHGARPPRAGENPAGWLARALDDAGARRLRHRGCHRYAFPIGTTRRERQAVHVAIPGEVYPKVPDLEEAA